MKLQHSTSDGPMRPSIRLRPSPALRAILERWEREAMESPRRPAIRVVKGGRP